MSKKRTGKTLMSKKRTHKTMPDIIIKFDTVLLQLFSSFYNLLCI